MTSRSGFVAYLCAALLAGCQRSPPEPAVSPRATAPELEPVVTVTTAAAAAVREHAQQFPGETLYLRVRVVPGGCQGFMHKLDLDAAKSDEDVVGESGGVGVVVSARQVEMLRGTRVDFGEEKGNRGFIVDNPNFKGDAAKKSIDALTGQADTK